VTNRPRPGEAIAALAGIDRQIDQGGAEVKRLEAEA
jgi:hypothetical protein